MNHAPAVQYPVGRSVWALRLQVGCLALWGLVQGLWWQAQAGAWPPGAWWFAAVLWGLCGVCWYWRARSPLVGELHWEPAVARRQGEGGAWRWHSPAYRHGMVLERLVRVLDTQSFLLVRARTGAGLTLWLWLEAKADPHAWQALRRAVQGASRA
ncbi:MAG TPA: hypothetical protein VFY31_06725 [Macromonas sp.]|nr:hypothetical protein [Macromonas sp.]